MSANRAMATKLVRDKVTLTIDNGAAVLRINGNTINGSLPVLEGGVITHSTNIYGDSYQFTWPDGTVVRAEQSGGSGMNVRVKPAVSRRGTLAELLGDANGSPENDLIGLRNARLGVRPSDSDVIHSLADAWRITQTKSLFDYQPGQSTATFADRTFPAKTFHPSKIANRAAAEKACTELEISDQHLLEDCILDLAVTNDFVFGSEYAHAQQVLVARAALLESARPAIGKLATVIMTGEILDSKSEPQFQFNAAKDDVIWIHDPDCTDSLPQSHPVFLTLFDPEGMPVGGFGQGCQFGRRELPATGTYTLKAKFKYQNEIVRYRIPIRFVRSDRRQSAAYGDMILGNIDQRAAHDVYTFTGNAGDVIKFSEAGCDLGSMIVAVIDPEGHDFHGLDCRADQSAKLPETGTYQLIINSWDGGPAPYHFVFQGGTFK